MEYSLHITGVSWVRVKRKSTAAKVWSVVCRIWACDHTLTSLNWLLFYNYNRIMWLFSSRMEHCHTSHYKSLHSLTIHSATNRCGCYGHIIWLPDLLDLMNDLFAWGFVKNFSQCPMYIGDVKAYITAAFTHYCTANSEWCGKNWPPNMKTLVSIEVHVGQISHLL